MINNIKKPLDWVKMNGLIPAVIQHVNSGDVLMLGYMNEEALQKTLSVGQLILYSRSKQRLWRKGETSGHTMTVKAIATDCDADSLLVHVLPEGPACHLGFTTCFQPAISFGWPFLATLITLISERARLQPGESYTAALLRDGISRCAQKVGEEAVETVIAAVENDKSAYVAESADLLYHWLVLCQAIEVSFYDILTCLQQRHSDSEKVRFQTTPSNTAVK
ncbi:bifunctional phosphoribosyl-AMP cyclohydrolase/phosphoribosyl-ATP diphosphatase HisIE [Legionella spiritensis]|uniref:Histidine biosynthesis bifunctional protein HisIE n=1 Tax=Legionella spiritensis TaxID=452 RepID=A0A0W0Z7T2_LEGSP|nr:bifunctional phosphoribosyl-AMP cyclohydrolase/phosphoribosyl-ATP diphosphatase HisIE [Legionella spiritensis]KTD64822.1 histidine biosynthesis bifunctional protein HisIE [Legionella spiritensis]SNV40409.1 phosphoribosyl-AMP cyclohydrolase (PRA-CH) / phosphoribosyl-ATP pyrophosphatase (PRA-PH) [Legionella spiritensis]